MDNHKDWDSVNCCTWSHNSQVVATSADDGIIHLNHAKTGKSMTSFCEDKLPILWVSFSSTSEHLASGNNSGQIQVWDVKLKKFLFSASYDSYEEITGVEWKSDDSVIIGITSKGLVHIVNFINQEIVQSLQYDELGLRTLKFSYFKKNILATSGDNGVVAVWDIKKGELYHAFDKSSHSNTCTGVVFSPTNELLLWSAGLDAKIQFFDILEKKTVKTIEANEAISALSFFTDGITIAAGTPTGKIYIYNLKDFNVKQILKGHEGYHIKYIEFVKKPKKTDHSKNKPKKKEDDKIKSYEGTHFYNLVL